MLNMFICNKLRLQCSNNKAFLRYRTYKVYVFQLRKKSFKSVERTPYKSTNSDLTLLTFLTKRHFITVERKNPYFLVLTCIKGRISLQTVKVLGIRKLPCIMVCKVYGSGNMKT